MESRERAVPRDQRAQAAQPQENGFGLDPQAAPRVNLGRAEVAAVNLARAEGHQVTMTMVHGVLMMAHGQIVPTMDVSSLFVAM